MRTVALLGGLGVLVAGPASAEPPVLFEVGINTRQFSPSTDEMVAFRTIHPEAPGLEGSAVTAALRFTRSFRGRVFTGVEAETGALSEPGSNLAGAYGVVGARGAIGPVTLLAELASGRRWIRYAFGLRDHGRWLAEPRVRAEMWMSSRFTLGAALGSTLGDHDVWMAGVYVGVHSLEFGGP